MGNVLCDERMGRGSVMRKRGREEERERERWIDLGEAHRMDRKEGLNPVLSMESATWEFIMYCATTVCMYLHICMYVYMYIYILL